MPNICDMEGVQRHGESDYPVSFWFRNSGRPAIRSHNEAGYSGTEVDLWDPIDWLRAGPQRRMVLENGQRSDRDIVAPSGDRKGA